MAGSAIIWEKRINSTGSNWPKVIASGERRRLNLMTLGIDLVTFAKDPKSLLAISLTHQLRADMRCILGAATNGRALNEREGC